AIAIGIGRTALAIDRGTSWCIRALVETVRHAVIVGIERTSAMIHRPALGSVGAIIHVIGHAVAVFVGRGAAKHCSRSDQELELGDVVIDEFIVTDKSVVAAKLPAHAAA